MAAAGMMMMDENNLPPPPPPPPPLGGENFDEDDLPSPAITILNEDLQACNDDNSNSTSGVENGPKDVDDYFDEELVLVASQNSGQHSDEDSGHEQAALLTSQTAKDAKMGHNFAIDMSENDILIQESRAAPDDEDDDDDLLRVDEDNNHVGGAGSHGVGDLYTKIHEMGNGNAHTFLSHAWRYFVEKLQEFFFCVFPSKPLSTGLNLVWRQNFNFNCFNFHRYT